jgi:hypothetical protein
LEALFFFFATALWPAGGGADEPSPAPSPKKCDAPLGRHAGGWQIGRIDPRYSIVYIVSVNFTMK